jgi:hypothetical protein
MLRVLRQFFSIPQTGFSDDEILHICGVLFVNAHEVPVTANPVQAIYRSASLIEHSCVNNASKHFDMNCNIQVHILIIICEILFQHDHDDVIPDSSCSAN